MTKRRYCSWPWGRSGIVSRNWIADHKRLKIFHVVFAEILRNDLDCLYGTERSSLLSQDSPCRRLFGEQPLSPSPCGGLAFCIGGCESPGCRRGRAKRGLLERDSARLLGQSADYQPQ